MMQILDHEGVRIPMRDGTHLSARVWRPASGPAVPAILEYIPYRKRDFMRLRDEGMHPRFAAHGYAAIRIDIRGSGDSEGVLLDEYLPLEQQDALDAIEWIAAQPWCDGNVGMMGKSWGAYNSLQVAALRPPALRAIIPVMGTDDRWQECIQFTGGALLGTKFWWASIMQGMQTLPPDPGIAGDEWQAMWRQRLEAQNFWAIPWLEHQTDDAYWRHGSVAPDYGDIEVPVYAMGGWADLYRDTPFRLAANLTAPCKVLMGPWAHLYPQQGVPGPQVDFVAEALRWWDRWLKGIRNGIEDEPRVRLWLQDAVPPDPSRKQSPGRWIEEAAWPGDNIRERVLHLNTGALGDAPEEGDMLRIHTAQTFGAFSGEASSFGIDGDMPGDLAQERGGTDFALPLDADMHLTGNATLDIEVVPDAPHATLYAVLIDEAPDGRQTQVSRAVRNLNDAADTDALTPGAPVPAHLTFHATAYALPAGHRLILRLATGCWPVLWPAASDAALMLAPGTARLSLPLRDPDAGEALRPLPAPPDAPPDPVTTIREGELEREVTTDPQTGEQTTRIRILGGVFGPIGVQRLDDIGTELGCDMTITHRIHPDDPLSARTRIEQSYEIGRDGWRIETQCHAEMSCDAEAFHVDAGARTVLNGAPFTSRDWQADIPRRRI